MFLIKKACIDQKSRWILLIVQEPRWILKLDPIVKVACRVLFRIFRLKMPSTLTVLGEAGVADVISGNKMMRMCWKRAPVWMLD